MNGPGDETKERALWHRWRQFAAGEAATPDALDLAAYAEGRLDEAEAVAVETWLAAHPEILADVQLARVLAPAPSDTSHAAIVAKACALVAVSSLTPANSNVMPLRRSVVAWRSALAWSSVAASLVAASLVGFTMGSEAYQRLTQTQVQPSENVPADILDASPSLDSYFTSNDSGT